MEGIVTIGNRGGIAVVNTTANVTATDVRLVLPNHIFRFTGNKGLVVLQLSAAIPAATTATLPILVEVNGETKPLLNTSGAGLTFSDITATTTFMVVYDKPGNTLVVTSQLV